MDNDNSELTFKFDHEGKSYRMDLPSETWANIYDYIFKHKFIYKYSEDDMKRCFDKAREMATPYIGSGYFINSFDDYLKTINNA